MDYKKLATFIIILGLIVAVYGFVKYLTVAKQVDSNTNIIERAGYQYLKKQPVKFVVAGGVIIFIGIAIKESAKKKD